MTSRESIGAAGNAYVAITNRLLDRAITRGIQLGVKAAMDYVEEERAQAKQRRQDRRLHNTRLLLKNYRYLKQHATGAFFRNAEERESAIDILDSLETASRNDKGYVDGIRKSKERTFVVIKHIDKMLDFYRISCESSGKPEELRRYRIIVAMYTDPKKRSAQEIAEAENIEPRTVYKDITKAIAPLSALIFGIDSLRFL